MRQVQLHEEEHQFAALVSQAEAGESLTILRHGRPVAQIIPFPNSTDTVNQHADRQTALRELEALMEKGFDLGIVWNGRDELYDRD
ncbi:hypothetical protein BH10ACI4_BH10ACI4_12050 [soil metagenome]